MAEEKAVKQLLEKTRRLPSNKACVNCGKEAPFGHGDVCVKFLTFICHTCKSAHQSFSHRCKSVTLSNWTMDEVLQLTDQRGGGNLCARATWLGALDHLMLKPDDTLERTKEFINQAYNYKRYWRDADLSHIQQQGASSASRDPPARQPRARAPAPAPSSSSFASPLPAPPAKAPAPSFMDFEADFAADFGAAPTTTPSTASSAAHDFGAFTAAPPASHDDGFGTSGFDFMQAPPPPPPPAPAPAPFDPFSAAPPLQPSRGPTANGSSGFDFMQPSAPSSFDPFGPSSSSAPRPSASKPAPPNSCAAFDMGGPPARPSGGSMMQGFGPAPGGGPAGPPRAMNAPPMADPFAALNAQPARGPFMGGPPPPRGMGMMGPGPGFGPPRGGPMMMGQPPRMAPPGGMMGGPGMMMGGRGGPMGGGMMMPGPPRGGPMGGGNPSASPPRPLFPSFLQQNDSQKEPDPFEGLMWGLGK